MDTEQLMNRHGPFLENEQYKRSLSDLIDRINVPTDEVQLSQVDKIQISFCLQFLRLELARNAGLKHD